MAPIQNGECKQHWFRHWLSPDGVGVLALLAVAMLDINTVQDDQHRWLLIGLHSLFLAFFVAFDSLRTRLHLSPHLLLAIMSGLILLLTWANDQGTPMVVFFFVLSALAHETLDDEQLAYLWVLDFGLVTILLYSLLVGDFGIGLWIGMGTLGGYLFIGSAARNRRVAERARAESQRLLGELQEAHQQLQYYAREAESLAAAEERNRLARELHDTLGHRLTVAAVQLEGAERLWQRNPEKAVAIIGTVRGQVLEGLAELRQTVAALRTAPESQVALPAALKQLAAHFSTATNLPVQVEIAPAAAQTLNSLDLAARQLLYRAVQEGLTNIQKHAAASEVRLSLELVEDGETSGLRLSLVDNGRGLDTRGESTGFGLRGLAERASQVGGEVTIQSRPEGGAHLLVRVPLARDGNQTGVPLSEHSQRPYADYHPVGR